MARRWKDLGPRQRRVIVVGTLIDSAAKFVALRDLRRRPDEQIRGSRRTWGLALGLINSVGVLPLIYFLVGRTSAR